MDQYIVYHNGEVLYHGPNTSVAARRLPKEKRDGFHVVQYTVTAGIVQGTVWQSATQTNRKLAVDRGHEFFEILAGPATHRLPIIRRSIELILLRQ